MNDFITMILPMVRKKLGGEYKVLSNSIVKTNDIKLNALTISKNNDVVAKNIYLGQYYEMYESGCVIDKIVEQIVCEATDNANVLDDRCREYVTNMYDYEKVKDKIVIKLVSLEKNTEYLKNKMYIKYLDFAMVFQLLITMPENRIMTSAVLSQVHKRWGVSEDELYVQALKNMQSLLPASLESLNSKILKMAEEKNVEFPEDIDISGGITPLYVLSNKYMTDGAAAILYKDVLKNFAKEQEVDEIIIIPSSVHEVLLLPKYEGDPNDLDVCKDMVKEVNATLEEHLLLSDNIYIYNKKTEEISIWNG